MHHSSENEKLLQEAKALGATGEFPEGKLTEHDEGEIVFRVGSHQGKVVIEFGTPVAWLGMTPQQALRLAGLLERHVNRLLGPSPGLGPRKTKPRGQRT